MTLSQFVALHAQWYRAHKASSQPKAGSWDLRAPKQESLHGMMMMMIFTAVGAMLITKFLEPHAFS